MEKLFIEYKDGGKVIITAKRKSGGAINIWNRDYASLKNRFQKAWVQQYPKKDNLPIILVSEGEAVCL